METITRRKFMGMLVGGLTAVKVGLGKSEQRIPDAKLLIDDQSILTFKKGEYSIYAYDIKAKTISRQVEYNVIDDLVEEMNKHDNSFPGSEFRYFIHCNYSGLGMLNTTGRLKEEEYEINLNRGYRYVLWIPVKLFRGFWSISVGTNIFQKADIILLACNTKECYGWEPHLRNYIEIAHRCFNVDYTKSGKALMERC